ncbi:hypothetical protein B0T18DRAFT_430083 [Schizothecium vesticola]|uniref:Uncharacterized protein n=1 Tax=Schizothecium vesticola TaxID=314040 RepID=A0AA40K1N9_9PEZI|nr:hypothetical protein B0T18DRAFT_430083 [Schizothecium vesticola]
MSLITGLPTLPALSSPPTPTTGLLTFFLPDSAPSSLVASVVQVTYVTTVSNSTGGEWVTSLVLDCPPTTKPVKDACRAAGIYPASVYHTRGSVWGGTTTLVADDSTTTWRCELGQRYRPSVDGSSRPGSSAYCTKTIEAPGKARETVTMNYDQCYLVHHQLPIVVTAGADKLVEGSVGIYSGIDAGDINSALASEAGSISGCPVASEVFWKIDAEEEQQGRRQRMAEEEGGREEVEAEAEAEEAEEAEAAEEGEGFGLAKGAMAALALLAVLGV